MSNVFNDVVELDSGNGDVTLLKGISTRSDIGFLSLFEHYNVCQVPSESSGPRDPGAQLLGTHRKEGEGELDSRSWERGPVSITEAPGKVWLLCHPRFTLTASRHPERDCRGFVA